MDATIIEAPSSTKNRSGQRDPEMRQVKKGNQYHFGMKLHIGVDAETGLVHSFSTTSANVHDVTDYIGVQKREENIGRWQRFLSISNGLGGGRRYGPRWNTLSWT